MCSVKRFIKAAVAATAVILSAVVFTGCIEEHPDDDGSSTPEFSVFAVNISGETDDWDYMIAGEDGSSMFIEVDEVTDMPTRLFLRPDRNSDDGFSMFFKENGLPDKMVVGEHVLYYGNFRGNMFDLAVIYPDNTIKYHSDIETDINWDEYINASGLDKALYWRDILKVLPIMPTLTCGATIFLSATPAAPLLAKACVTTTISYVAKSTITMVFDGFVEDAGKAFVDVLGCAAAVGDLSVAFSCAKGLISSASLLTHLNFNLTTEKAQQINEAIRKIDGDGLTIIPRELLEYFLILGIEVNSGNNPPNVEGTYLATPLQIVRSTAGNIVNQWDMYVTFSEQNHDRLTISANYTMQDANGGMSSSGTDAFIVGEGNKFTVFLDGTREQDGFTGKTVEVFSGEITATGIRNYQWAVFMVDNNGDPLGIWIDNGTGYFKSDSDGFSGRVIWPPIDVTPINTVSAWQSGNIADSGGEQWFSFTATANTQYIHFNPGTLDDVDVQLYNSNGSTVGSKSNLYSLNLYTSRSVTSGQAYYIRVSPYYLGDSGDYQIAFNASTTAPEDGMYRIVNSGSLAKSGDIRGASETSRNAATHSGTAKYGKGGAIIGGMNRATAGRQ